MAPRADEGRGKAAKSPGELSNKREQPGIPEWGNPTEVMLCYPRLNT